MPPHAQKFNGTEPAVRVSEPRQIGEVVDLEAFIIATAIRACCFHSRKAAGANDPDAQVRILRTIAGIAGRAVQFHEDRSTPQEVEIENA